MKVPKLMPATSQIICRLVSHMICFGVPPFRRRCPAGRRLKAELRTGFAFAVIHGIVPARRLVLRRFVSLPFVHKNFQRLDRQKVRAYSTLTLQRGVSYARTARGRRLFSCALDRSTCAPTL